MVLEDEAEAGGAAGLFSQSLSRVKIFLSPLSHEISAGAGREAQGGEGARQGGGAGAGVAAGGGVLHIGLNFLDLIIIILDIKRDPCCRCELLRFCKGNPLSIGASAGDGRVHLQGAGVPLTGETRGAQAGKGAQAEGGA